MRGAGHNNMIDWLLKKLNEDDSPLDVMIVIRSATDTTDAYSVHHGSLLQVDKAGLIIKSAGVRRNSPSVFKMIPWNEVRFVQVTDRK